jgi:putative spermidine/putrescine transport system substrate-binding protein
VIAAPLAAMPEANPSALHVATWGGAYGQSQQIAYFTPYAKETGTEIKAETYDGSLAALKQVIGREQGPPDLVDLSAGNLSALCSGGLLETIDPAGLKPGPAGESAAEDFYPGALSDCGVASVAWSMAIAFNRRAFGKSAPSRITDFADVKRFPGKRALPGTARYTLEFALLADGVAPADIYTTLATPEGADRAFAVLDKLKPNIIWWDKAKDPVALLLEGEAAMAAGYSGRLFRAAVGDKQLGIIWDGQIYDLDVWAIPKGSKNKDAALKFIGFATEPARMAAQAQLIAYGPMRKSALPLVGKHPVIGVEMLPYLPTAPDNFKTALRFDEAWWNEHGQELTKRFDQWHAAAMAEAEANAAAQKAKEEAAKAKEASQAKAAP